jgi:hypothetical protein
MVKLAQVRLPWLAPMLIVLRRKFENSVMQPNTEHLPGIGSGLSHADVAAERFRASIGQQRLFLRSAPDEWKDRFTPEMWDLFSRDRYEMYHSEGGILSPEEWLENRSKAN